MVLNNIKIVVPDHVKGWLLDVYPSSPGKTAVWIISEKGERLRYTDNFQLSICVYDKKSV